MESLLQVRLDDASGGTGQTMADPTRMRHLIDVIKPLLEDMDSDAVDLVEELANMLRGTPMSPIMDKITDAVANYDFETAMDELQKLEV